MSLTGADLRYAYNFEPPYAERDHLFGRTPGRPVLVAIGDSLQRDKVPFERATPEDHTYTWRMNTHLVNQVSTAGSGFTITAPNGATVVGRAAGDGTAFTKGVVTFDTANDDDPGFQAVSTTTAPRRRFDQLTVLALTPPGPPATTSVLAVRGGNAVAVDWNGGRDVVVRRLKLSQAVTGAVTTDGTMAKFTQGEGDTIMRDGTRLVGENEGVREGQRAGRDRHGQRGRGHGSRPGRQPLPGVRAAPDHSSVGQRPIGRHVP